MNRNNKIPGILFVIVFILIIIIEAGRSDLPCTYVIRTFNPDFDSKYEQEQTKYQYLGAEKCALVCHNNDTMGFQYNSWKASLHSEAFKILYSKKAILYAQQAHVTGNAWESSMCLKCHTTGGDLDSSYFTSTYRKEEGITCEACHKHSMVAKTYIPAEEDCLICHNKSVHKVPKFNFEVKNSKIAHFRPKQNHHPVR
jgi:hypothetical protein